MSRIGNGLSEGELMPQKYDYKDSGYSITAVERKNGKRQDFMHLTAFGHEI